MRSLPLLLAAAAVGSASPWAHGQCNSTGPDATISDLNTAGSSGSSGGVAAFVVGAIVCNRGSVPLPYGASRGGRPLISPGAFRLSTVDGATRLEQVGLGWCFNTFSALQTSGCCAVCTPPTPNDGTSIGIHCTCPESPTAMGTQSFLSPRFGVNATTGEVSNPSPIPPATGVTGRRLQVAIADIDPALNPGAHYFVELQTVTPDDVGANRSNNSSFRACGFSGSGTTWSMALQETTSALRPAIYAWQDADPAVVIVSAADPSGGQILLGARVTPLDDGRWRYEYAVQNVSSDRSVSAIYFAAPPEVHVTSPGFHDVSYHSGDGAGGVTVSGTDWQFDRFCDIVSWRTETYASNPNANALRWGTLYNFRFDGDSPPNPLSSSTLFFFKPGAITVAQVPGVPGPRRRFDADGDGQRTPADVAAFVGQWFAELSAGSGLTSDFDHNGAIEPADIAGFVALWFDPQGC